jgi:hemoglobin
MSENREMSSRGCDLDSEVEIAELMKRFYSDIAQDEALGHIFNDVAHVNWDTHIPHIASFWNKMLFGTGDYVGNPLEAHQHIHEIEPFTHDHFRRWLELFQENVDSGWEGPNAETIKRKAVKIALVQSRILTGEPLDLLLHIDEHK